MTAPELPQLYSPKVGTTLKISVVLPIAGAVCTTLAYVYVGRLIDPLSQGIGLKTVDVIVAATLILLAGALTTAVIGITGTAAGREEKHLRRVLLKRTLAQGPVGRSAGHDS